MVGGAALALGCTRDRDRLTHSVGVHRSAIAPALGSSLSTAAWAHAQCLEFDADARRTVPMATPLQNPLRTG